MPIDTQGWFLILALSYQYRHKNGVTYFRFEQLSIISVVSLLLISNKNKLREFCLFQYIIFMFQNIISGSEHKWTHKIWEEKNKKWALEKKPQKKNKLFYWEVCNILSKIFYCICKYFIMWDAQSHSIIWWSGNNLENGSL